MKFHQKATVKGRHCQASHTAEPGEPEHKGVAGCHWAAAGLVACACACDGCSIEKLLSLNEILQKKVDELTQRKDIKEKVLSTMRALGEHRSMSAKEKHAAMTDILIFSTGWIEALEEDHPELAIQPYGQEKS